MSSEHQTVETVEPEPPSVEWRLPTIIPGAERPSLTVAAGAMLALSLQLEDALTREFGVDSGPALAANRMAINAEAIVGALKRAGRAEAAGDEDALKRAVR